MATDGSLEGSNMLRFRAEMCAPSNISLVDSDLLSDIVFVCGDDFVPIKSHKLILRNWSNFFSKIVECTLSIQGPFPVAPVIVLKEVPGKDLRDILKFIYTGDLVVEQSRIQSILKTAKFLEVERLPEQLEASEEVKASLTESTDTEMDETPPLTKAPLPIESCPPPPQDEMDPLPLHEMNSPNQTEINSPQTEVNSSSLTDVNSIPATDLSFTPSPDIDSKAQSEKPSSKGLDASPSKKVVNPLSSKEPTPPPLPTNRTDCLPPKSVDNPQTQSETESSSPSGSISPVESEHNSLSGTDSTKSTPISSPCSRNSNGGINNHSPAYKHLGQILTTSSYFLKRNFDKSRSTQFSSMKKDQTISIPQMEISETIDLTADE